MQYTNSLPTILAALFIALGSIREPRRRDRLLVSRWLIIIPPLFLLIDCSRSKVWSKESVANTGPAGTKVTKRIVDFYSLTTATLFRLLISKWGGVPELGVAPSMKRGGWRSSSAERLLPDVIRRSSITDDVVDEQTKQMLSTWRNSSVSLVSGKGQEVWNYIQNGRRRGGGARTDQPDKLGRHDIA